MSFYYTVFCRSVPERKEYLFRRIENLQLETLKKNTNIYTHVHDKVDPGSSLG